MGDFLLRYGGLLPEPAPELLRRLDVPTGASEATWNEAYAEKHALYQERTGPDQPRPARFRNMELLRELERLRPVLDNYLKIRQAWQLLGEASDQIQNRQQGRARNRLKEAKALMEGLSSTEGLERWHADLATDLEAVAKPQVERPSIVVPPSLHARENEAWAYAVEATGGPVSFLVEGLPKGLVFHPKRGTITGAPAAAGVYPLIVTAENESGNVSATLILVVEPSVDRMTAPKVVNPAEVVVDEGQELAASIMIWPPGSEVTLQGLPEGVRYDPGKGSLVGRPAAPGEHRLRIVARNEGGVTEAELKLMVRKKEKTKPRELLCRLLDLPTSISYLELARARTRRLVFLQRILSQRRLSDAERGNFERQKKALEDVNELVAQLERISDCYQMLTELQDGLAMDPPPPDAEIEANLARLRTLLEEISDPEAKAFLTQRTQEVGVIFEEALRRRTRPPMMMFFDQSLVVRAREGEAMEHRLETVPPGLVVASVSPLPKGLSLASDGLLSGVPSIPGDAEVGVVASSYGQEIKAVLRISIEPRNSPKVRPSAMKGTFLEMTPVARSEFATGSCPIHLVARPTFTLGRRRRSVDFVAWFLPGDPVNHAKTMTISRVHATLSVRGSQILVQDGGVDDDGKYKASSSGTMIDGHSAGVGTAVSFPKARRLSLGGAGYELQVEHLAASAPSGPFEESAQAGTSLAITSVVTPKAPLGCLKFTPMSCREVVIDAIWMFSEISVGSGARCAVRLASTGPEVAARIHHWDGCFWIVNPPGSTVKIVLDGRQLDGGEVAGLQAEHEIAFDDMRFTLKVT